MDNKKIKDQLSYVAIYGNTTILKGYCNDCNSIAFIKKGILQCCEKSTDDLPKGFKVESEAQPKRKIPPLEYRKNKLEEQNNKCFYCEIPFGEICYKNEKPIKLKINWDHFVPFDYGYNNGSTNFVASCQICNGIKADKFFDTVESARSYVIAIRQNKNIVQGM